MEYSSDVNLQPIPSFGLPSELVSGGTFWFFNTVSTEKVLSHCIM